MAASVPASSAQFEFTKRKRYADLLATELSSTVSFILSLTGKILYCGSPLAMGETLGWAPAELKDINIDSMVDGPDQPAFRDSFNSFLKLVNRDSSSGELLIYARLRHRNRQTPSLLFEMKGRVHHMPSKVDNALTGSQPACVLLSANLYPSRSTSLLNTFQDLKVTNERLKAQLGRIQDQSMSQPTPSNPEIPSHTPSTTSSSRYNGLPPLNIPMWDYSQPVNTSGVPSNSSATRASFSASSLPSREEDEAHLESEGPKKKKVKRNITGDVAAHICVTCGRTDSPEWRKGPMGPKTLCNACGLRWAKQAKTMMEEAQQ